MRRRKVRQRLRDSHSCRACGVQEGHRGTFPHGHGLASDDVEEVRRVLESGEARPNDDVGPQSALAFTLANGQLKNKMAMVKLLLAYGADASALREADDEDDGEHSSKKGSRPISKLLEEADPATRCVLLVFLEWTRRC